MALINIQRVSVGGVDTKPGKICMVSTDTLATICAPNYLVNGVTGAAYTLSLANSDMVEALYNYDALTNSGDLITLQPVFTNGIITLVQLNSQMIANTTAAYAGGGTSNAFAAPGLTVNSKRSAVIRTSANSVAIAKALPGTNTLTITFTADPGAGTTVDYIYSNIAQAL